MYSCRSHVAQHEYNAGRITTAYYNELALRVLLKPHKFEPVARVPPQFPSV